MSAIIRKTGGRIDEFGELLVFRDLRDADKAGTRGAITTGIVRGTEVPDVDAAAFDLLLTTAEGAPRPWVFLSPDGFDAALEALTTAVARSPIAATVLAQVLRINESLPFDEALLVESFAYSTLLGGGEFGAWRDGRTRSLSEPAAGPRVQCARDRGVLTIRLCNPRRRNAFDARLRDELLEALRVAEADTDLCVELRAEGPHFCTGGDLAEFGQAADLAVAHAIRIRHSVCGTLHKLGSRATSYVHGACIGAGIEIPAAARIVSDPGSQFRLPEIAMGLIPGAGGTASLPRRIGRHRTLYWALTGQALDAVRALEWGLVDCIGDTT